MKYLIQGHTAGNRQSWDLILRGLILETALNCYIILSLEVASCPVDDSTSALQTDQRKRSLTVLVGEAGNWCAEGGCSSGRRLFHTHHAARSCVHGLGLLGFRPSSALLSSTSSLPNKCFKIKFLFLVTASLKYNPPTVRFTI